MMTVVLYESPARPMLAAVVERLGSQTKVAVAVGTTQSSISQWITGKARPAPPHRRILATLYGIAESEWETAEERASVERALAAAVAPQAPTGTEA